MLNVVIEKGIAIPEVKGSESTGMQRTLEKMEVGDSFAYPSSSRSAVSVAIYRHRKAGGVGRFSYRKQDVGYRVWRVE